MYKLLLCLRYVRTRYIALASIISVMLGVATMIVVNSVMCGFQSEMYKRLHGILSDVVVESHSLEGITEPDVIMKEIRDVLGEDVVAMTPTVHVPALLSFRVRGEWMIKQINLIGVDETTCGGVSDFSQYLLHPKNREKVEFTLRNSGYPHADWGWSYRQKRAMVEKALRKQQAQATLPAGGVATAPAAEDPLPTADPFAALADRGSTFDPMEEQHTGIVMGIALASFKHRNKDGQVDDYYLCRPGDDVQVSFPGSGTPPKLEYDNFTVVDFYESKMSEYDSTFAFVPLSRLQQLRGMIHPETGVGAVTTIQLKLAPGVDLAGARDKLRAAFPPYLYPYHVQTWTDMQGPLLAAVKMETTILNILLFLIIAVAGFGILATFYMIVVEKTRDIGILKSLGAPSGGVMSIFLGYGLSLGIIGSGVGLVLGLLFVWNINDIAAWVGRITGREVFDPTIYYFQSIPTIVQPFTLLWIVVGAMTIAVSASVLPALRAARLNPVEALRYE
jgi:lipoprotein-releasing system permease protein